MPRLMAVSFSRAGRLHYLDPGDLEPRVGDRVLFPTSLSPEVCEVVWGPEEVDEGIHAPVCAGIAADQFGEQHRQFAGGRARQPEHGRQSHQQEE